MLFPHGRLLLANFSFMRTVCIASKKKTKNKKQTLEHRICFLAVLQRQYLETLVISALHRFRCSQRERSEKAGRLLSRPLSLLDIGHLVDESFLKLY